jgi:hypothetical protein
MAVSEGRAKKNMTLWDFSLVNDNMSPSIQDINGPNHGGEDINRGWMVKYSSRSAAKMRLCLIGLSARSQIRGGFVTVGRKKKATNASGCLSPSNLPCWSKQQSALVTRPYTSPRHRWDFFS